MSQRELEVKRQSVKRRGRQMRQASSVRASSVEFHMEAEVPPVSARNQRRRSQRI